MATEIIAEKPVNMYELKATLEAIKKRDKELNFRANKTEEYLNQVLEYQDGDKLFDKLMKLEIPRLRENHIHKIVDVTPTTVDELKVVLQAYTITISNDSMKKIIDEINKNVVKK